MKLQWTAVVGLLVVVAVGGWLLFGSIRQPADGDGSRPMPAPRPAGMHSASQPDGKAGLPRLVDLGAKTCIPCKMMAPILDDLRRNYADQFVTEFIDVTENPQAGRDYGIRRIPTQVFLDASGRELYRHEDFLSKAAILAKWKELGVDVR